MNRVKISSPATIANLVCGFDILGLAISANQDYMEMSILPKKKVIIQHLDNFGLPEDPTQNVAGVALLSLLKDCNEHIGFKVIIDKKIKPGSGLGSSAASAAGAIVGANHLMGNKLSPIQMIKYAMNGEKLASGIKHADNIAPCIMGGITLIRGINPLDVIRLPYPNLYISIIHPQIEVKTSEARAILQDPIPLKLAIKQWGNIAGLVAGLCNKDYNMISNSLVDYISEPARSKLIPGFNDIKQQLHTTKILGCGIAGSGPSIFAFSKDEPTAQQAEKIMTQVYTKLAIANVTYISKINPNGTAVHVIV